MLYLKVPNKFLNFHARKASHMHLNYIQIYFNQLVSETHIINELKAFPSLQKFKLQLHFLPLRSVILMLDKKALPSE